MQANESSWGASATRRLARHGVRALAASFAIGQLPACGFGVPAKSPTLVTQQAKRTVSVRIGESSRADVQAALGEPWLRSIFWRFDVFRAEDEQTEVDFLVAYDPAGRVAQVASGSASRGSLVREDLMLRTDDLTLAIEPIDERGLQLFADPARLPGYLERRRGSPTCTLVLACDFTSARESWPDAGCPDRVVIDDDEPLDPRPVFGRCDAGRSCPPNAVRDGFYVRVPLLYAVALSPGRHRLVLTSSIFKGGGESALDCVGGEVRYGVIRGLLDRHWWGPQASTLNATVIFSEGPPANLASYGVALYRRDRWLVESEPDRPPE